MFQYFVQMWFPCAESTPCNSSQHPKILHYIIWPKDVFTFSKCEKNFYDQTQPTRLDSTRLQSYLFTVHGLIEASLFLG